MGGPLRGGGQQNAVFGEDPHGGEGGLCKRGVNGDRFSVVTHQADQFLRGFLLQRAYVRGDDLLESAEKARHVDRVDPRLFHQRLDDLVDHVGVFLGRSAVVDRIRCGHSRQQERADLLLGRLGQNRNLQAEVLGVVRGDRIVPAAFGDDRDAVALRQRHVGKGHRDIEHLVHVGDPDDSRLPEGRIDNGVIGGQGPRVGGGGPRARLAAADLEDHDRLLLRDFPGGPDNLIPFLDPLHVHQDRLGSLVLSQILDVFVKLDADGIARGDDVAQSHPAHLGIVGDRVDDVSALGDDGQRTLPDRRDAQKVHPAGGAEEAGAVGTDDLCASFGCDAENLRLDFFALLAGFSEACRDDHDPLGAHLHAVGDSLGDELRGDDDHDQIDLLPDIEDRGVGFSVEQLVPLGIDEKDLAGVASLDQAPRPAFGRLTGNLGGPDHRDGGRFEKTLQRLHHILLSVRLGLSGKLNLRFRYFLFSFVLFCNRRRVKCRSLFSAR